MTNETPRSLTPDELTFYDALEVNDSAVKILGDATLKEIAQVLVKQVRRNISIDWELKDATRAHMRVIVKRILRRYGYPPDKQRQATETVVKQAEWLSKEWMEPTGIGMMGVRVLCYNHDLYYFSPSPSLLEMVRGVLGEEEGRISCCCQNYHFANVDPIPTAENPRGTNPFPNV